LLAVRDGAELGIGFDLICFMYFKILSFQPDLLSTIIEHFLQEHENLFKYKHNKISLIGMSIYYHKC